MKLYAGHDGATDATYLLTVHEDGSRVLSTCTAENGHEWAGPVLLVPEPVPS